jgi:SAM-dependent methyltransferase
MTEDVPFYVGLAVDMDGPLVELAVGTGRVAVPVALATSRTAIGMDSSPAMLAQARTAASEAGVVLDLREGDMRDLELDEPAGLIYCPYRALLHLPTWADRRHVFDRVARSLRPGGTFAWNAFAFDHHVAARPDGQRQDRPVPHRVHFDIADNRLDLRLDDGSTSSLWWRRRTSGSGYSRSPAWTSRRSTATSIAAHSTTRAGSTSLSLSATSRPVATPA